MIKLCAVVCHHGTCALLGGPCPFCVIVNEVYRELYIQYFEERFLGGGGGIPEILRSAGLALDSMGLNSDFLHNNKTYLSITAYT